MLNIKNFPGNRTKEIAEEILKIMPSLFRRIHSDCLEHLNLSPAQLFVLFLLEEKKICCLKDISREMTISPPTVTGIVDRLERGGYIKRTQDKKDRRIIKIISTKKADSFMKDMRTKKFERAKSLLSVLSREDQENYLRILKILLKGMQNEG